MKMHFLCIFVSLVAIFSAPVVVNSYEVDPCNSHTEKLPGFNEIILMRSPPCKITKLPKVEYDSEAKPQSDLGYATFVVTDSLSIDNDLNDGCHLRPGEQYLIVCDYTTNVATIVHLKPDGLNLTWLTILLLIMICFIPLFTRCRKILNGLRELRRENLASLSQTVMNLVKSTSTLTSQHQRQATAESADVEPLGVIIDDNLVTWNRYSYSVSIKDFENYVKEAIDSGALKSEFNMFPRGLIRSSKYGSLPENKPKNRYRNIIAYDDSRVVLKKLPGDLFSDYINANYVPGFRKKKAYIAAQGPNSQTVVDFWRMIWQEESLVICMLANVSENQKIKCEQYWPEFGASKTYGDIVVVTESHRVFSDYIFRILRVSCKGESRKIEHLHYTGWPDHNVPIYSNSVIAYLKKLLTVSTGNGPVIVHCSAGVGRTGTIILCDLCLRRATIEGTIDVLAELKKLRDSRMNLVDSELQYLFAHIVIAECLLSYSTALPCNNDLPQAIEELKKALPQHIERLCSTAWQDQALHPMVPSRPALPEQLAKNRFPALAPASSGLVYLKRYPRSDSNSDYISAVIVNGLRAKKQFLAAQLPLPTTLSDFWRLIAEQRVELVIVLQQPDLNDLTCCEIIPDEIPFNPVPFISVELKTRSNPEISPRIDELLLSDTTEEATVRTQNVTMLTCTEWGLGKDGQPPSPMKLVELWIASEKFHREIGPTLVLCQDGVTGCGLYLALSFLLERMAVERECDVIFAVRAVRRSRPDFVQSEEQFEYLYDAAAEYVEYFEKYSNFA